MSLFHPLLWGLQGHQITGDSPSHFLRDEGETKGGSAYNMVPVSGLASLN